jgi:hypothetical protein
MGPDLEGRRRCGFDDEAEKLCVHFSTAPTSGLGLIKRALDAAEDNDLSAQLDLERNLQREAGSHPNYREGVQAFLQKRKAEFLRQALAPEPALFLDEARDVGDAIANAQIRHHERSVRRASFSHRAASRRARRRHRARDRPC